MAGLMKEEVRGYSNLECSGATGNKVIYTERCSCAFSLSRGKSPKRDLQCGDSVVTVRHLRKSVLQLFH